MTTQGTIRAGSEADRSAPEADSIRAIERQRLRALVEANIELAQQLHADDFQLINPGGGALSKAEYLGGIASGYLRYVVWEPEAIGVRIRGEMAVIRYQSRLAISVGGAEAQLLRYWHTDTYEKQSGRWQIVWSQATEIK
ncbi:MAG TPA: nuclear transport factor 2 family protein [Roseiflexaceae bacterium]|nr:nuclear transport factor 2 family protein [Roseiflexaceae bacterium]